MRTAIYPGSFDPVTLGHLDIIRRASVMFDRLVVAVMHNQNKKPMFSVEERMEFLRRTTDGLPNVEIASFGGLLADYMQKKGLTVCVRGVRNGRDCEFELENHRLSRAFFPSLQTVLLPCEATWADVSSSAVKAACAAGRLPAAWVPANVAEALKKKYPALQIF